jgi:hypothetical protein
MTRMSDFVPSLFFVRTYQVYNHLECDDFLHTYKRNGTQKDIVIIIGIVNLIKSRLGILRWCLHTWHRSDELPSHII